MVGSMRDKLARTIRQRARSRRVAAGAVAALGGVALLAAALSAGLLRPAAGAGGHRNGPGHRGRRRRRAPGAHRLRLRPAPRPRCGGRGGAARAAGAPPRWGARPTVVQEVGRLTPAQRLVLQARAWAALAPGPPSGRRGPPRRRPRAGPRRSRRWRRRARGAGPSGSRSASPPPMAGAPVRGGRRRPARRLRRAGRRARGRAAGHPVEAPFADLLDLAGRVLDETLTRLPARDRVRPGGPGRRVGAPAARPATRSAGLRWGSGGTL